MSNRRLRRVRQSRSVIPRCEQLEPRTLLAAPTASAVAPVSLRGSTYQEITVTYADDAGVDPATMDSYDLRVTGPNSFNQFASFIRVSANTVGTPRTAVYRIAAPGGEWGLEDNGAYAVVMEANQVRDNGAEYVAAGTLTTYTVNYFGSVVDQAQTSTTGIFYLANTTPHWQEFVPVLSTVNQIRADVEKLGNPGSVWFAIDRADNLQRIWSQQVSEANLGSGNTWTTVIPASPVTVIPGVKYRLVVWPTTTPPFHSLAWYGDNTNRYPAGVSSISGPNPNFDFAFEIRGSLSGPGTIRYVDDSATGANTGASWSNAYTSLQSALAAAKPGDQIWVAAGVYKPTTTTDMNATFTLKGGVDVFGGFAGYESSLSQRRISNGHQSILSGDIGIIGDSSDNSTHVVTSPGDVILDGFTITKGHAGGDNGGGLSIVNGSPVIRNCAFTENYTDFDTGSGAGGGAAAVQNGQPLFLNCLFYENVGGWGGAMYVFSGHPSVVNCTFTRNHGLNSNGAISTNGGSQPVSITNSILFGDTTDSGYAETNPQSNIYYHRSCIVQVNGFPATGAVAQNPQFVTASDPDGLDNIPFTPDDGVRLLPNSPCIDAAAGVGAYVTDALGHARVDVAAVTNTGTGTPGYADIGAYEATDGSTALANLTNVTASGIAAHTFTVTYTGSPAINAATIDAGDIVVVGPNGYQQVAALVGVTGSGASRTATYSVTPPGATWLVSNNGTYAVLMQTAQVADTAAIPRFVQDGRLGAFQVNISTLPSVSINDVTITEGTGTSAVYANFTITLSKVSAQDVTIDLMTVENTASVGRDYYGQEGYIVIPANTLTWPVSIEVVPDAMFETNESFFLLATGAANAVIGDPTGIATINNDDAAPTIVDVMVLYTAQARSSAGGVAAIRNRIAEAITSANEALANSNINGQLHLVHSNEIVYTESGVIGTDLDHLEEPGDGFMDSAQTLRTQYGADLVSLFTSTSEPTIAGLANLLNVAGGVSDWAYSVVRYQGAASSLTFIHELGHNFGATHDVENAGIPGLYSYSYGYRFTIGSTTYRTLMAYDPGVRIPYFSNPQVMYEGVPIGDANADNARTLNQSMPIVAGYRNAPTISSFTMAGGANISADPTGIFFELRDPLAPAGAPLVSLRKSQVTAPSLTGSAADEVFTLDLINGNPIPSGGFTINGGGGTDRLVILGTAGVETFTLNGNTLTIGGLNLNLSGIAQIWIEGNGAADTINGAMAQAGNRVLRLSGVAIGNLDVQDNYVIVHATPATRAAALTQIKSLITSGYNAGGTLWMGSGITSTQARLSGANAVGYMGNSSGGTPTLTTFGGMSVTEDDILLRYTLGADADLDGNVSFADLVAVAQNYNAGDPDVCWQRGDFNYDGSVSFADLVAVAQRYNSTLPAAVPAAIPAAIPEPATTSDPEAQTVDPGIAAPAQSTTTLIAAPKPAPTTTLATTTTATTSRTKSPATPTTTVEPIATSTISPFLTIRRPKRAPAPIPAKTPAPKKSPVARPLPPSLFADAQKARIKDDDAPFRGRINARLFGT